MISLIICFFCWDGYFVWHSRSLVMQCFLWRYLNAISTPWGNGKDCLHCHLCPCHLGFYWELKIRQDMQHHSWRWSFFCVEGWFKKGDSKGAIGGLCLYSFSMFGFVMAFPLKLSELGAQTLRFGKCCACLQVSHFLASSFSLCLSCAFLEAQPRAPGDEIKARKKTRQRGSLFGTEPYMSCKLYNIYIDPSGPHPKRWSLRTYVSLWQALKYHLVSWWPFIDFFLYVFVIGDDSSREIPTLFQVEIYQPFGHLGD